jgi:glycosyltransferase involved in cell wall biosynthesis
LSGETDKKALMFRISALLDRAGRHMGISRCINMMKRSFSETARLNYRLLMSQRELVTMRPGGKSKGNVLLSYITHPFRPGKNKPDLSRHSNVWQCREMVRIWNELGYTVDVIDWDNQDFLPARQYDFFIDIHSNLERLAPLINADCVKILYVTGAHWLFQNKAEYDRLLSIQKKRGVTLYPRRLAPPSHGMEQADRVIILGNDFTVGTFDYLKKPVYMLKNTATRVFSSLEGRDWARCRKSYLWIGSTGLALKGLDMVLEAFASLPDYSLTVCGPVDEEKDFRDAFYRELFETPNIRTIGFVETDSGQFSTLVRDCAGLVYPSSSDSQAGSVILCMHAGLIPLVSYESGVDTGPGGTVIRDISVEKIRAAVETISALPEEELARRSQETRDYAKDNHSQDVFSADCRRILGRIVAETKGNGSA